MLLMATKSNPSSNTKSTITSGSESSDLFGLASRLVRFSRIDEHSRFPLVVRIVRSLLRFRQLARFVVGLAVELLYFLAKIRAVIALGIRQGPGLPLVIPIVGIEPLRLLEMRNRVDAFSLFVEILSQRKLRISA